MKIGEIRSPVHILIVRLFAGYSAILLCILSCRDPEPVTPVAPTMEFLPASSPFVTGNDTLPKEGFIAVHMSCSKGSGNLKELVFLEDDVLVDTNRIDIVNAQGQLTVTNPFSIPSMDQDQFEYAIWIDRPGSSGLYEYTYTLLAFDSLEVSKTIQMLFYDVPLQTVIANTNWIPTEIIINGYLYVELDAIRGTSNFNSLEIYEDSVLITDLNRIFFNSFTITGNPLLLQSSNTSYRYYLSILVIKEGLQTFTFKVTDQDGYTSESSVTITGV